MLNKYTRYDPTEMKMHTINYALPVLDFHTCTVPRNIQDEILFRKLPLHQVHICVCRKPKNFHWSRTKCIL